MKAARIHRFGERLQLDDVEEPQPGPGEVVVQVDYMGVNPLDIWVTQGSVAGGRQELPFVPGTEAAGTYEGRRYVIQAPGWGTLRDGMYREQAAVPRSALVPLPDGVDPVQAAALGVAGVTAWRLVHDVARVTAADRVLVLGAAGGVGSILVQFAARQGAVVWGQTGNGERSATIRELGAEHAVVCDAAGLPAAVAELKPTVAFDPLGGAFTVALVSALEPHGRLALFGTSAGPQANLDLRTLYRKALALVGYSGTVEPPERLRAGLEAVIAELARGNVRVPVEDVLPLDRAAEAHERILQRKVRGKLLLRGH